MKRLLVLFLLMGAVILTLTGCGKEEAKNPIDGEYKIVGTAEIPGFSKDTRILVDHAKENIYRVSVKDSELTKGMALGVSSASWDEDHRVLNTDFGPIYFTWFEYNVINIAPFRWVFNLEGTIGSKSSDVRFERVKAN